MTPKDHPLFKRSPLDGSTTISTGEVPVPYHSYNGAGLFIGGTGDLAAAKRMLKDEAVLPAQTSDGRAVMGIWICDFTEASLGPHHELQFSFLVSETPTTPVAAHPLNTLALLLTHPDVRMLCHGPWNNTPAGVAYNRELLSLNARLAESRIEREAGQISFQFKDGATHERIVSGKLIDPHRVSPAALLSLLSTIGLRGGLALAQQPWLSMTVLNPVGVVLNRNAGAETFTKNDRNVVRFFDSRTGALEFGDTPYRSLNFVPTCVQYMDGFKFVYRHPS